MEEAQQLLSKQGRAAGAANHPLGETGFSMNGGVAAALAQGKYTRYPGVHRSAAGLKQMARPIQIQGQEAQPRVALDRGGGGPRARRLCARQWPRPAAALSGGGRELERDVPRGAGGACGRVKHCVL